MNKAAAEVMRLGHIPVIGVNAALPVVECMPGIDRYDAIMKISLAVVDRCDAILILGDSPGVSREMELLTAKGLPVFRKLSEIPAIASPRDAT